MTRSKENIGPTEVTRKENKPRLSYSLQDTMIPGVSLRVEHGQKANVSPKEIRQELLPKGRKHRRLSARLKKIADEQNPIGQSLKDFAQNHEGLRGFQSKQDNLAVNIIPRDSVTYDIEQLEEDLGAHYKDVVTEDYVVAIKLPRGYRNLSGEVGRQTLQAIFERILTSRLNFSPEEAEMLVSSQLDAKPDEKKLKKLIDSGEVSLSRGTRKATRVWSIATDLIRKPLPRDAKPEESKPPTKS